MLSGVFPIWRWTAALCLLGLIGAERPAVAAEFRMVTSADERIDFNLPSQALSDALQEYARLTGMAAMADHGLIEGRWSTAVKGSLTADQALRILLTGTGLTSRYVGQSAFTLERRGGADKPRSRAARGDDGAPGTRSYFGDLQASLIRVLCLRKETQPGRFRLALQIWIGADGRVLSSYLLDPADDARRAVMVEELLRANSLAVPPSDLPQPVTIVLLPNSPGQAPECGADHGQSR